MKLTVIILSLLGLALPAKAEDAETCQRTDAKLKPSERIERLEQRVLACDLDLRLIAKEKDDRDRTLSECRRAADRSESEVGKLKDELLEANKKRLELETATKELQARINGMVGKYEIVSTATALGIVMILAMLASAMAWAYVKYRKTFPPKKHF